jgi:prepilin-type N-terminal cleavage/methylation domain-containing protein
MWDRGNAVPAPGRAGFTLIEVLVATSLLTIGLGTAAFLMASAYGTYRNQNRTLEMNHLVHDQLETLTSTAYETLKADITKARNPGDPFRPALPPERDFEKAVGNGVIARFELVPPPPDQDDYKVVRKGDRQPNEWLQNAGKKPNNVDVSLKLEYWDPVFDEATATDKGLIRASYGIEWGGARDRGVKYYAR